MNLQRIGADIQVVVHQGKGVAGCLRLLPGPSTAPLAAPACLFVAHVVELTRATRHDALELQTYINKSMSFNDFESKIC